MLEINGELQFPKVKSIKSDVAMATAVAGLFIANYSLAFVRRTYIKQFIWRRDTFQQKRGTNGQMSLHIFKCAMEGIF